MNAITKLFEVKKAADAQQADRENYKAYVQDRIDNGGWTDVDVSEYRSEVERIMKSGTDDEKQAASEFWRGKVNRSAIGINARIRRTLLAESS